MDPWFSHIQSDSIFRYLVYYAYILQSVVQSHVCGNLFVQMKPIKKFIRRAFLLEMKSDKVCLFLLSHETDESFKDTVVPLTSLHIERWVVLWKRAVEIPSFIQPCSHIHFHYGPLFRSSGEVQKLINLWVHKTLKERTVSSSSQLLREEFMQPWHGKFVWQLSWDFHMMFRIGSIFNDCP